MDLIQKALATVFSEKSLNLQQYNYYNNEHLQCFPHTLLLKFCIHRVDSSGKKWLLSITEVILWVQSITGVTQMHKHFRGSMLLPFSLPLMKMMSYQWSS